ncbi:MAG: hypothetical protein ACREKQ_03815 [Candidatus Rokuibacteriota bacterium]
MTEPGLDAVGAPAGAREVACPLCTATGGPCLRGHDRKAGLYQNPRPDPARVIDPYERGHYRWLAGRVDGPPGARILERSYRVTDVPLRGARAPRRRLEGRARWPEWKGSRA